MQKKSLVIDSSVAVKWVNSQKEKLLKKADRILMDVQEGKVDLLMPELAKYEVGNALLYKQMSTKQSMSSMAIFLGIPIRYVSLDKKQAVEIMKVAKENEITFYDAAFLALAKQQEAILVTANPKHQKKVVTGVRTVSLEEYGEVDFE